MGPFKATLCKVSVLEFDRICTAEYRGEKNILRKCALCSCTNNFCQRGRQISNFQCDEDLTKFPVLTLIEKHKTFQMFYVSTNIKMFVETIDFFMSIKMIFRMSRKIMNHKGLNLLIC